MQVSTHLTFAGNCQEAFTFYAHCLGGELPVMLTYGDSPAASEVPDDWRDKIVHATLTVGNTRLNGADVLPSQHQQPQGFFVLLQVDRVADARRIFDALAENGVVRMPIQKTFWSPAFGVVVDRFGVPWEISCGQ